MLSDDAIYEQLAYVLKETHFDFLGERYQGKVRDSYVDGGTRYCVTSDRMSAFDVVIAAVPFKGEVLTQLAVQCFEDTRDIVQNHLLDTPDPNVMVVRNCKIIPIELIVRGYLTGSAWRDYAAGRPISGITLPAGLRPSQKLPENIITPSTKAEIGSHDEPLSEKEILFRKIVDQKLWSQIKETALALFQRGQQRAKERGLILVDTKYEFGLAEGKLILADEIHTLDSSRYWIAETYQKRFESGEAPEMLDKEPIRQWLLQQGYQGEGAVPKITDEYRVNVARHYIDSYEKISGRKFEGEVGPTLERIERNLRKYRASIE